MEPIQESTKQALSNAMNKSQNTMIDFFHSGITQLGKEANHTIDLLFGKKWPKSSMITRDMSQFESKLITLSEDTILTAS